MTNSTTRRAGAPKAFFLSELLRSLPDEGAQVLASQLALHFKEDHSFRILGPRSNTGDHERSLTPRSIGRTTIATLVRSRARWVVYMPQSGLTAAAVVRLLIIRLVRPFSRIDLVVTQIHASGDKPMIFRAAAWLATAIITATDAQRELLSAGTAQARTMQPRVPANKVSTLSISEARRQLGFDQSETIFLHVGHAREGRGLHHLKEIAPHGRFVIILSTAFPEEAGVVPQGPGIDARRGNIPNLRDYYRAADVYVFPTASARSVIGIPMSIVEALANGTPVVALRSEVTARFENTPNVTLCDTPQELIEAARALGSIIRHDEAPHPDHTKQHCFGDFSICRDQPFEEIV